jgi:uncharacterized protein
VDLYYGQTLKGKYVMYIKRDISTNFHHLLHHFKAVLVTGARQTGKTTFLRNELAGFAKYISLDDPLERQLAIEDPNLFLDRFGRQPIIIDEIQYAPNLFSYIKIRIDDDRFTGKTDRIWILTGSQQFQLMKNISDTLAGRIAIIELFPFSYSERMSINAFSLEDEIWHGGYPENTIAPEFRTDWCSSYIATYLERDVRQLYQVMKLNIFQDFIGLCAANHGQEINYNKLATRCGISQATCKEWINVLEASYILKQLPPYYDNLGKRIIKSSKLYFWDSALVAYLTRQSSAKAMISGAMSGSFFEGFIVAETNKILYNQQNKHGLFFWRSHDGIEIDMLLLKDNGLIAIEIKLTSTPMPKHAQGLLKFANFAENNNKKLIDKIIVCNVLQDSLLPGGVKAMNWKSFLTNYL